MELLCPICQTKYYKSTGHVNRAKAQGLNLYCGRKCAGIGRRNYKPVEQRKSEKALYDQQYRKRDPEALKMRKQEYYQRTKDPVKEAIKRKKRMHLHVEYCRQPEYKAWKKEYDLTHRAKQDYGEFAECALILRKIFELIDNREVKAIQNLNIKSIKRKRSWLKTHNQSLQQSR